MYSLLLGAIAGDICGSSYEHTVGRTKNYDSVQLFRTDNDFTDDTVCTIGIAAALIENPCPTAEEFGKSLQKYCRMYPYRGTRKLENAIYDILPGEILDVIEEFEDHI